MAETVNRKRRYDSPRRREQAAATRRSILDAAQRQFERRGYAAATMAAIASEAGVALKTVYVAFETKSGLLRALWHLLLRGDEDRRPGRRAAVVPRGARRARPREALRLTAYHSRRVKQRIGGMLEVIRNAASAIRTSRRCGTGSRPTSTTTSARSSPASTGAGPCARPRRHSRGRYPLDAQPSGRLAAARRATWLDGRASGRSGSPTRPARSSWEPIGGYASGGRAGAGDPRACGILAAQFGAWRSLVARTVRVGEVPGSNPGAPICVAARSGRGFRRFPGRSEVALWSRSARPFNDALDQERVYDRSSRPAEVSS